MMRLEILALLFTGLVACSAPEIDYTGPVAD